MSLLTILLVLAVVWLAYANGANDNFKGVATLFGSGTTSFKTAIWWAGATTFAGSICAFILGAALIRTFSGKGLVDTTVLSDPKFLFSVAMAAAATVYLATQIGFPISTTHAILGALVGAGLIAPGGVEFLLLGSRFVLPLLSAPLLAIVLTLVLYKLFRYVRLKAGIERETCICVGQTEHVVALESPNFLVSQTTGGALQLTDSKGQIRTVPGLEVKIGETPCCRQRYSGSVIGISAETIVNALHFITAGTVGFARGLQDTAKIVGLLVGAALMNVANENTLLMGVALVAIFMALGGILNARRVAETLSHKITDMNAGQGFTANLVTSFLVIGSSLYGWGVSTTHCSVGALFGIGIANGTGHWPMIRQIVLAWLVTLPCAALFAVLIYAIV